MGEQLPVAAVMEVAAKADAPLRAMHEAETVFLTAVMNSSDEEYGVTLFLTEPPTELCIVDTRTTQYPEFLFATVEIRSTWDAAEAWGWAQVAAGVDPEDLDFEFMESAGFDPSSTSLAAEGN